ncbi:MAG TPA: hypothetical protein VEA69_11000 [Tepidisphaeraceae bacterium]|nr:hypothetical protein [Tepidisphaeraceae bacterium]
MRPSSDPLPIVFVHRGNSAYLPFTLAQAKLASLSSPVVLLGDRTNNQFPFVTHADMSAFAEQAAELAKVYKHRSPNGAPYELFCFQRWFILRDFMRANSLERIVHVDSDVLLYVDVNVEQRLWRDYDLTLVRGVCAGNMFVNRRAAIEDLCDWIWDLYTSADSDAKLDAIHAWRSQTGEGVSDMVALKAIYDANRSRVAEMTGVRDDDSYWDANIHLAEGFEHDGTIKRIRYHDRLPYGRHLASARDVRFKALHFQGVAKRHIEPHFRQGCPATSSSIAA